MSPVNLSKLSAVSWCTQRTKCNMKKSVNASTRFHVSIATKGIYCGRQAKFRSSRGTWESTGRKEEQPNKSAITDHVTRENHVIDWNQVKVVGHESDRRTRWIKEAIAIHKCKESVRAGTPDLTFYCPAMTSSFSMNQLILMEMTLHGVTSF